MKTQEALKLALEALEEIHPGNMTPMAEEAWNKAITAIRKALAEQPAQQRIDYRAECWPESPHYKPAQQQEPVAWMYPSDYEKCLTSEHVAEVTSIECTSLRTGEKATVPLYTSPPASKPCKVWDAEGYDALCQELEGWKARALKAEAKLREKNA